MAEYMFGVAERDGRTSAVERDRRHAIAKKNGARWTEIYDQSTGKWKSWFHCWNTGEPFTSMTEHAVLKEVSDG